MHAPSAVRRCGIAAAAAAAGITLIGTVDLFRDPAPAAPAGGSIALGPAAAGPAGAAANGGQPAARAPMPVPVLGAASVASRVAATLTAAGVPSHASTASVSALLPAGTLGAVSVPTVLYTSGHGAVAADVAQQLGDTVAQQLGDTVAQQRGDTVAQQRGGQPDVTVELLAGTPPPGSPGVIVLLPGAGAA